MPFQKGHIKLGGRQQGVANKRTRAIAEQAHQEGITPLEVQLRTMRALWKSATDTAGEVVDFDKAAAACAVAERCAPYMHPRLAAVEARVQQQVDVSQISEEEHEARARELIRMVFREPDLPAVEHKPIFQTNDAHITDVPSADENVGTGETPRMEQAKDAGPRVRDFARSDNEMTIARRPPRAPRPVGDWSG